MNLIVYFIDHFNNLITMQLILFLISQKDEKDEEIYASIQMLRQYSRQLNQLIEEELNEGNEDKAKKLRDVLKDVEEQLKCKDERRFIKFGVKNKNSLKLLTEISLNKSFKGLSLKQ